MTPARLKQLRSQLGWSQARLADELGLTRQQVWNLETGRTAIKRALELAVLSLLEGRQIPEPPPEPPKPRGFRMR